MRRIWHKSIFFTSKFTRSRVRRSNTITCDSDRRVCLRTHGWIRAFRRAIAIFSCRHSDACYSSFTLFTFPKGHQPQKSDLSTHPGVSWDGGTCHWAVPVKGKYGWSRWTTFFPFKKLLDQRATSALTTKTHGKNIKSACLLSFVG